MRIEIPLTRKQSELDLSLNQFDITGYGGAKGGGKSHGLRSVILLRSLKRKGHVGAIFRRSYPELEENHIAPLFRQFPKLRQYYNSGRKEIRIPHLESEVKFRFCESMNDVDKYAGREYHTLGIEEAGDWPLDMTFRLIRNCNRSTQAGIKAATALTFNWGGVGHGGLKRIFVTKDLREHEKKLTYNFILAKVEDNPAILERDPGYLDRLESEPNEALRRAYRHGDPDIVAGQYFDLVRSVHVVKPFLIPGYWNWFGAYDYGYNHPTAILFFAVNQDGEVYLVHEIIQARTGIGEQAEMIHSFLRSKKQSNEFTAERIYFHAGHDCWAKKKGTDPTIAEDFENANVVGENNRVILVQANIDRILGAYKLRQFLSHRTTEGRRVGPNLYFFENCKNTIEAVTRMVHDPHRVEDVMKVDAVNGDPSTGDDAYDALRMGIMSRPMIPIERLTAKPGTPEYVKEQEELHKKAIIEKIKREQAMKEGGKIEGFHKDKFGRDPWHNWD